MSKRKHEEDDEDRSSKKPKADEECPNAKVLCDLREEEEEDKCPDARELCKSLIDWKAFRKQIFKIIRDKVEENKKEKSPLCTTGWIHIKDEEFADPRFQPFVQELRDHHWEVELADGGTYRHIMGINWQFIY